MARPSGSSRWLVALALSSAGVALAVPGWAQGLEGAHAATPGESAGGSEDTERLELAKRHFRDGVALLNEDRVEEALGAFEGSRGLVASGKNTINAAICLQRLGRYDEALVRYEDVAARFSADLPEEDRLALEPTMEWLRARLGHLMLSANMGCKLVIDGVARGELPLPEPVQLLPGKHRLLLTRDGYATIDRVVNVQAGRTLAMEVELWLLHADGRRTSADGTPEEKSAGRSPWGLVALVGGGTLAAAGVATWIVSAVRLGNARQELDDTCALRNGDECTAALPSQHDAAQAAADDVHASKVLRTVGIASTATGLTVALAGLYLQMRRTEPASPRSVSFRVSNDGFALAWQTAF